MMSQHGIKYRLRKRRTRDQVAQNDDNSTSDRAPRKPNVYDDGSDNESYDSDKDDKRNHEIARKHNQTLLTSGESYSESIPFRPRDKTKRMSTSQSYTSFSKTDSLIKREIRSRGLQHGRDSDNDGHVGHDYESDNIKRTINKRMTNDDKSQQNKPVSAKLEVELPEQDNVKRHNKLENRGNCQISVLSDRIVEKKNSKYRQSETEQKSRRHKSIQCSESGSLLGKSILCLKDYFLPVQHKQELVRLKKFQLNKSRSDKTNAQLGNPKDKMSINDLETLVPSSSESSRKIHRKSSTRARLRDSQHVSIPNEYTKLNHHYQILPRQYSLLQELRRLLLLIVIVGACCILLWQLYQALIGDLDYLGVVDTPSELGIYQKFAVSTDAAPCAKIGKSLLDKNGSAVDAAIGTLLCMGVVIPNSLGLGGGCLMTIYNGTSKEATVINGREIAPDYASEDMFKDDPLKSSRGPLSIGIPGELAAYWKAHQHYGKLNWSELFDDSIKLAEEGVPVVEHLSFSLTDRTHSQFITKPLAKLMWNTTSDRFLKEGELLVQKELANTLRRIRDYGEKEFYGGLTGQRFVKDLEAQGGNITLANLKKYQALEMEPLKFELGNLVLYAPPIPGSGLVLSIILRIMKELGYQELKPQLNFDDTKLYYHRLVEAMKFAYAQRAALEDLPDDPKRLDDLIVKLKSDEFIRESVDKIDGLTHDPSYYGGLEYFANNHGTAHVSVLDAQGNAAAVTTSINLYFGSGLVSPSTGIIYNDVMDDFVSPDHINRFNLEPSKYNRIRPGRRPLSSMSPSIFTDKLGNVRLVIGGSGGSKITTAIASVSLRNCFLGEDIKTAIDGPRIHHQYLPNQISYEKNFPEEILQSLKDRGHKIQPIVGRSSVIMGVTNDKVNGRSITANSDYRKQGSVAGE